LCAESTDCLHGRNIDQAAGVAGVAEDETDQRFGVHEDSATGTRVDDFCETLARSSA